MTFAGIFHLIAKGMPEATSNARLRAQVPKDGWRSFLHTFASRPEPEHGDAPFKL